MRQIALGNFRSCVLRDVGTVACWGLGNRGQLGHGAIVEQPQPTPVEVEGIDSAVHIAVGDRHSCAAIHTGEVYCWGQNWPGGALGKLGEDNRASPMKVEGVSDVIRVGAGFRSSCGLQRSGGVVCWGALGAKARPRPIAIHDAVDLDVGGQRACAVRYNGEVACWGELGPGLSHSPANAWRDDPVEVRGLGNATQVFVSGGESCALRRSGELVCWGPNIDFYQSGKTSSAQGAKAKLERKKRIPKVLMDAAIGELHSCVVSMTGIVQCWGNGTFGQLGDGKTTSRSKPVQVVDIPLVRAVSVGHSHTCAILRSEEIRCWGRNDYGQSGRPGGKPVLTPFAVSGL